MSSKLTSSVIILVSLVWAANFTAPLWIRDYNPAPELNVAFMAIVGVLTAKHNKDSKKDDKGTNKGNSDEARADEEVS